MTILFNILEVALGAILCVLFLLFGLYGVWKLANTKGLKDFKDVPKYKPYKCPYSKLSCPYYNDINRTMLRACKDCKHYNNGIVDSKF